MNPAAFQRKEKGNMKAASSLDPSKALVPSRKPPAGNSHADTWRGVAAPDRTTKAARLYVSPRARPLFFVVLNNGHAL